MLRKVPKAWRPVARIGGKVVSNPPPIIVSAVPPQRKSWRWWPWSRNDPRPEVIVQEAAKPSDDRYRMTWRQLSISNLSQWLFIGLPLCGSALGVTAVAADTTLQLCAIVAGFFVFVGLEATEWIEERAHRRRMRR